MWKELIEPGNPGLVLHDSGGFEAGGTAAVEELLKFIEFRRKKTDQNEMLHCIWLVDCLALVYDADGPSGTALAAKNHG